MLMTADEQANLVLAFAKVLYVNGQATEQTVSAAERLARARGLHATIMPRWGELQLVANDRHGTLIAQAAAYPAGVEMDRVASTMRAIEDVVSGRLGPDVAVKTIDEIARSPPAPTWLFTLAAAAGAVALAVIFGVQHFSAAILIFVSAGSGAILRRALGQLSANFFLQPFGAAILAGIIGAMAVRYDLSSSLRLVAVCPGMVLVPGPHFLNSALDLINGRIALGTARLMYAGLIVVAISVGLLIGLALLGVSLPADSAGRVVPLWQDVIAAGVAVAAYSVFFSTPPAHAAVASRRRHVWARFAMGGAHPVRLQRSDRRLGCLRCCRPDPHSSLATNAHAICSNRVRFGGVDGTRRLLVQDGEWALADRQRLANDTGANQHDDSRRPDRRDHHLGDELRSRRSEAGHRLFQRSLGPAQIIGGGKACQISRKIAARYKPQVIQRMTR
jgi:uncharacterized membrane protein YjjP (DUF1212 family)